MFKEIVSKLTQKTLNSANIAGGQIADHLVGNLKDRSPVLGDLAGKYLDGKRAKAQFSRDQIHASRIYAAENVDKDFGQEVKKEHKDLNPQDLAKKMEEILSKLQKTSEKSPDKLKEDPLYKKYGKFFDENKQQFKASRENKSAGSAGAGKTGSAPDFSEIVSKLDSIETNTAKTAAQIEKLSQKQEEKKETAKQIDKTDSIETNTAKTAAQIEKLSQKQEADERDKKDSGSEIVSELKKISKFLEVKIQSDKLAAVQSAENANESLDIKKDPAALQSVMEKLNAKDANGPESNKSPSLLQKAKDLIFNRTTTTSTNKPGTFRDGLKNTAKNKVKIPIAASKLGGAVKSIGSVGARALGSLASFAANPVVLGTAAATAAGYGGYKAGEWLNENTNIQSNIADGGESVKGWFGNSFEDKQKAADHKSTQDLYDKRVVEGKLNSKNAELFEKQGIKVDKSKIVDMPTPVKSEITKAVTSTVATQESLAAKPAPQVQPIVLNNKTSTSSGSSGSQMITGVNVRNSDTTFERVQMQDFWPRTE